MAPKIKPSQDELAYERFKQYCKRIGINHPADQATYQKVNDTLHASCNLGAERASNRSGG